MSDSHTLVSRSPSQKRPAGASPVDSSPTSTSGRSNPGFAAAAAAAHLHQHHLRFEHAEVRQPLPFLLPTGGKFTASTTDLSHPGAAHTEQTYTWSSRSSRKNRSPPARHPIEPHPEAPKPTHRGGDAGQAEKGQGQGGARLGRAASLEARIHKSPFKPHLEADCSFWVAVIFTAGSTVWIINGFFVFLPLLVPAVPLWTDVAGALAFVGGTLFELGSYLMLVEAWNTGHEQMFSGPLSGYLRWRRPSEAALVEEDENENDSDEEKGGDDGRTKGTGKQFRWWGRPAWRDLGFLACFVQLIAATVFWVSTITGLPGVIPSLFEDPPVVVADIFYWTPQVLGGFGFVLSSLLLMIETQSHWYTPNPLSIGWQVAVWNLVGALGFLLCGAFGYLSLGIAWENYQSACTTFWGSWAFLIGSVFQLYETIWREEPEKI